MATKYPQPSIWVIILPKLLTGTVSCEWSAWFRSHYYSFDRIPSDFNFTAWKIDHTQLLDKVYLEYKERFNRVKREGENKFELKGTSGAKLVGQPDLIGISEPEIVIGDVKTGKESEEHEAQILVYLYAIPRCFPALVKGRKLSGELHYKNGEIKKIIWEQATKGFKERLAYLLKILATFEIEPRKISSAFDCSNCSIADNHCPERFVKKEESQQTEFPDF